jgi:transposase-like protein
VPSQNGGTSKIQKEPMKTGRPSRYSPEIADAICDEIATTDHALHRICEREGMPEARTVYRWLESFRQQYARARFTA